MCRGSDWAVKNWNELIKHCTIVQSVKQFYQTMAQKDSEKLSFFVSHLPERSVTATSFMLYEYDMTNSSEGELR